MPPSTHTDEKGNVVTVKNDGNLGLYKHSQYIFQENLNDNQIEMIDFGSVVLGDALINKRDLKYN